MSPHPGRLQGKAKLDVPGDPEPGRERREEDEEEGVEGEISALAQASTPLSNLKRKSAEMKKERRVALAG